MKDHAFGKQVLVKSALVFTMALTTTMVMGGSFFAASRATAQSETEGYAQFYAEAQYWAQQNSNQAAIPPCLAGNGSLLGVNNEQVVEWKHTSQNQFHSRGHIRGPITKIFPDATGHDHVEVTIGPNQDDTIEVIYNGDFGALPALSLNQTVEACGDYITSNARSGGYPASPDGAILHWVHLSTNAHHPSGYVAIDGVPYGIGKQQHVKSNKPPRNTKH